MYYFLLTLLTLTLLAGCDALAEPSPMEGVFRLLGKSPAENHRGPSDPYKIPGFDRDQSCNQCMLDDVIQFVEKGKAAGKAVYQRSGGNPLFDTSWHHFDPAAIQEPNYFERLQFAVQQRQHPYYAGTLTLKALAAKCTQTLFPAHMHGNWRTHPNSRLARCLEWDYATSNDVPGVRIANRPPSRRPAQNSVD